MEGRRYSSAGRCCRAIRRRVDLLGLMVKGVKEVPMQVNLAACGAVLTQNRSDYSYVSRREQLIDTPKTTRTLVFWRVRLLFRSVLHSRLIMIS